MLGTRHKVSGPLNRDVKENMIRNILHALELFGSLLLIVAYGTYRRGPAAPWANRTLLYGALCGLGYALIGVVRHGHGFGLSPTATAALASAGHALGGVAVGLILSLVISGQLWKIGARREQNDPRRK